MKNIIPFKKDVIFKTNISEVTSISLENTLSIKDDIIKGDFLVSGEYKISDKSTSVDPFSLNLPFEIVIDERYNTEKATADIDDFYYEIVNDNVLRIAIDVLIDNLEERPLINEFDLLDETPKRELLEVEEEVLEEELPKEEKEEVREAIIEETFKEEVKEERCIESETEEDMQEKINSLFSNFSKDSEVYVTYNVYIVRDGDTLESILAKYDIELDELKKYNDLSELKLGDKLIIPNTYETN